MILLLCDILPIRLLLIFDFDCGSAIGMMDGAARTTNSIGVDFPLGYFDGEELGRRPVGLSCFALVTIWSASSHCWLRRLYCCTWLMYDSKGERCSNCPPRGPHSSLASKSAHLGHGTWTGLMPNCARTSSSFLAAGMAALECRCLCPYCADECHLTCCYG